MKEKKVIIFGIIFVAFVLAITAVITRSEYKSYSRKYNEKINALVKNIGEHYPEITDQEIIAILNSSSVETDEFFSKYGIDLKKDSVVLENGKKNVFFQWVNMAIAAGLLVLAAIIICWERRKRQSAINKMADYLHQINAGDYHFDMEASEEGEMSSLESELYKTTIMLKEVADNSLLEKQRLKDSLSDISHQLKTPLTSLVINLDNLRENSDMDEATRNRLISMAKRDTNKISQMVQQLLTLSKLDANVIEFKKEQVTLLEIVEEAILNVSALSDLKSIPVVMECENDSDASISCDRDWEIQAITNILKNGIEHAASKVTVNFLNCELYKEIIIENDGEPISEIERKNLFNRFYSGEHSIKDSVGIGLSIANAVVLNDGGYIVVESDEKISESGVKFIVRYV